MCIRDSQDIARLPQEVQHTFALQIYSKNIPKSTVECLVTAYNNKTTPAALKQEIIKNPALAIQTINPVKVVKCVDNDTEKDISTRWEAAIRLLLKLIAEVETYLAAMNTEDINKYHRLLAVICHSMGRFIKMVEQLISPGKPVINGGVDDGNG